MNAYKVLAGSLSRKEMERMMEKDGTVEGIISMELSEAINLDLEGFLDTVSEKLTGSCLLSGTDYDLVGHDRNTLHLRITGDASLILAEGEE